MNEIKNYIEKNKERFLEELFSLIRIPSISTKEGYENEIRKCAERYVELLKQAGIDTGAEICETKGNPIIYAEKIVDKKLPTILVYAHYDVVDADPKDWKTNPFEPEIINGKIVARGADDDKGQGFMHVKAVEYMIKNEKLPCNIKFVIEGEEEIASKNFESWLEENKEKRELDKCDFVMVSDTKMIDKDNPCIMTGLRGICKWEINIYNSEEKYFEIIVSNTNKEVHSGHYGGAILNPINELAIIIDKVMKQYDGHSVENEKECFVFFDQISINAGKGETKIQPEARAIIPCDFNWGDEKADIEKNIEKFKNVIKKISPKGLNVEVNFYRENKNALAQLCSIISQIRDEKYKIAIPCYYDNVVELKDKERKELLKVPYNKKELQKEYGIQGFVGEEGYETIEHVGTRPSIDVLKLEGCKTAEKATAIVSSRIVPNQTVVDIDKKFRDFVKTITPEDIKMEVIYQGGDDPYSCGMDSKQYEVAKKAFDEVYGKDKVVPFKNGGSIGAISIIKNVLKKDSLIIGFGLNEDAIHSANENYPIEQFTNGIETIINFYKKI